MHLGIDLLGTDQRSFRNTSLDTSGTIHRPFRNARFQRLGAAGELQRHHGALNYLTLRNNRLTQRHLILRTDWKEEDAYALHLLHSSMQIP